MPQNTAASPCGNRHPQYRLHSECCGRAIGVKVHESNQVKRGVANQFHLFCFVCYRTAQITSPGKLDLVERTTSIECLHGTIFFPQWRPQCALGGSPDQAVRSLMSRFQYPVSAPVPSSSAWKRSPGFLPEKVSAGRSSIPLSGCFGDPLQNSVCERHSCRESNCYRGSGSLCPNRRSLRSSRCHRIRWGPDSRSSNSTPPAGQERL
jgi:hypothetical protein